jgi:hypothetical protein
MRRLKCAPMRGDQSNIPLPFNLCLLAHHNGEQLRSDSADRTRVSLLTSLSSLKFTVLSFLPAMATAWNTTKTPTIMLGHSRRRRLLVKYVLVSCSSRLLPYMS